MRKARPRHRLLLLAMCVAGVPAVVDGQSDSTRVPRQTQPAPVPADTVSVQGSIYTRPFIASAGQVAIGGYAEGNTNYFVEDGVSDGFSMEFRRFNIFLFSPVSSRLKFFSELEFEHGTEEIAIETAQLDFRLTPSLSLRAGIILPPIGAFNQNHDSPRWEFIDRPLVSTTIIPSTLSEVGFGVLGRLSPSPGIGITYDAYVTNGLDDGLLLNEEGRTWIPGGKADAQFAGDNNGTPALSARVALQSRASGEVGVSYYGATYNTFREEGVDVDERRRVTLVAVDVSRSLGRLDVRGEAVHAWIDVPSSLGELLGRRQRGAHLDFVLPILRRPVLGMASATLNLGLRLEYVDYNIGRFASTGAPIRDDVTALVPGLSFRPVANSVFKANYRWHTSRDVLGNDPSRLGGYQLGFATYF